MQILRSSLREYFDLLPITNLNEYTNLRMDFLLMNISVCKGYELPFENLKAKRIFTDLLIADCLLLAYGQHAAVHRILGEENPI